MATVTYDPTPADQPEFRESEVEALQRGEEVAAQEAALLAGKFKSQEDLETAYLELQKKLGEPRDEVPPTNQGEESPRPQEVEEQPQEDPGTLTEQQAGALMQMVGGEAAYNDMLAWAGQELNSTEINMFDGVIQKGDPASIYYAVQNLFNRYQSATGSDGELLTGRGATEKPDVFRSQAEVVAAMRDPRYDKDPAFRQDIYAKLERSNIPY